MKLMHEKTHPHGIFREGNLEQEELAVVPPNCFYQDHFCKKTRHRTHRKHTESILEGANKQKSLKGNRPYTVFSKGRTMNLAEKQAPDSSVPRSKNSHALHSEQLLHFS